MTYTHDLSVYDEMNREDAIKHLRQTAIKISVYLSFCDHHNKEYDYLNRLQKEMCIKMYQLIKKQLLEEAE